MAVFDDVDKTEALRILDKGVQRFGERSYVDYGEFQLSVRDGNILIPRIEMTEPLKNQCLHFLECIKERKEPLTNGEEGLKVVKILEAAQESLKDNGKVVAVEL
jgi:predicted dehydrogenase